MTDREMADAAKALLTWLKAANSSAKITAAIDAVHTSRRDPLRFIPQVK